MKHVILGLIALISVDAAAQISKNVGDFDEVKVFDRISVELIHAPGKNLVEIDGKRRDDVEVINRNGELKLRMRLEKLLKGEEIQCKVYYSTLEDIEAGQGSYISSGETLKQRSLELNAKEGSQIKLMLDVEKVDLRSVTGGIVTLSGTANEVEANIGTGGILDAKNLRAGEVDVSINAGGEASVFASEMVEASVRAGGDIIIYGNPKKVNKETRLGGTIRLSE